MASVQIYRPNVSDATLDAIQAAGFTWVRVDFDWESIESIPNRYKFTIFDSLMSRLAKRRIRVLATLGFGNDLYQPLYTLPPLEPAVQKAFLRFVRATVSRYSGKGVLWEIWNEPNLAVFWVNPNPADYTQLAIATAQSIRSVAPQEWVCAVAATFPTGTDIFIEPTFQLGILDHVDAVSMHAYIPIEEEPEYREASWQWLRGLISLYAPEGKKIEVLSSESGFSRYLSVYDPVRRAELMQRYLLSSMISGLAVTNVFAWTDAVGNPNPINDFHGLTTLSGQETPALVSVRRLLNALNGWTFEKRLRTESVDDYVALFSRSSEMKLVCWTRSENAHSIVMDSSECILDGVNASGTFVLSTSGNDLTIPLSRDPSILTPRTPNPLLVLASDWGRVPVTTVAGSVADVKAAFESIVLSPAWSGAPAGTTLTVEDLPDDQPKYKRLPFTRTFSNLTSLTATTPSLVEFWNLLPCVQDHSAGSHMLRFTVTLPDGSSIAQEAAVLPRTPLSVDLRSPGASGFSVWIGNPSGRVFSGSMSVDSGLITHSVPVSFALGERSKRVVVPALPATAGLSGVGIKLYSSASDVRDPDLPVVETSTVVVTPVLPMNGPFWSVEFDGEGAGLTTATWSNTVDLTSPDQSIVGILDYQFTPTPGHVLLPTEPSVSMNSKTHTVGMWVHGDGAGTAISTHFMDANDEVFRTRHMEVDWVGWKWIAIETTGFLESWGPPGSDGVVQYPLRLKKPIVLSHNLLAIGRPLKMKFQGITLLARP